MNRLILLPVSPLGKSGYSKAVSQDVVRLNVDELDHVIVYNHRGDELPTGFKKIERLKYFSATRILNVVCLKVSTDISSRFLKKMILPFKYDQIFCGDIMFYHAARKLFPNEKLFVRFHNLFSLSKTRQFYRQMKINSIFRFNIYATSRLEREILQDSHVYPIFINSSEADLFKLVYPGRNYDLWSPAAFKQRTSLPPTKPMLVYFGSYVHHQKPGLDWFLANVFAPLHRKIPELSMNFWGVGGGFYHAPDMGIHYHGDFVGEGLPMEGAGFFVNPDILGGGIKFKIAEWLERGVPFISTPYGIEGYAFQASENIIVSDLDNWKIQLENYFKAHGFCV